MRSLAPAIETAITRDRVPAIWLLRVTIGATTWHWAEMDVTIAFQAYGGRLTVLAGPKYGRSVGGNNPRVALDNLDLAMSAWLKTNRDLAQGARAVLAIWFIEAQAEHVVFDGDIAACEPSEDALVLSLAGLDLTAQQLPAWSCSQLCPWVFKSAECGYTTGGLTTCDKTFAACTARERTHRFSGVLTISRTLTEVIGGGAGAGNDAGDNDGGKRADLLITD